MLLFLPTVFTVLFTASHSTRKEAARFVVKRQTTSANGAYCYSNGGCISGCCVFLSTTAGICVAQAQQGQICGLRTTIGSACTTCTSLCCCSGGCCPTSACSSSVTATTITTTATSCTTCLTQCCCTTGGCCPSASCSTVATTTASSCSLCAPQCCCSGGCCACSASSNSQQPYVMYSSNCATTGTGCSLVPTCDSSCTATSTNAACAGCATQTSCSQCSTGTTAVQTTSTGCPQCVSAQTTAVTCAVCSTQCCCTSGGCCPTLSCTLVTTTLAPSVGAYCGICSTQCCCVNGCCQISICMQTASTTTVAPVITFNCASCAPRCCCGGTCCQCPQVTFPSGVTQTINPFQNMINTPSSAVNSLSNAQLLQLLSAVTNSAAATNAPSPVLYSSNQQVETTTPCTTCALNAASAAEGKPYLCVQCASLCCCSSGCCSAENCFNRKTQALTSQDSDVTRTNVLSDLDSLEEWLFSIFKRASSNGVRRSTPRIVTATPPFPEMEKIDATYVPNYTTQPWPKTLILSNNMTIPFNFNDNGAVTTNEPTGRRLHEEFSFTGHRKRRTRSRRPVQLKNLFYPAFLRVRPIYG